MSAVTSSAEARLLIAVIAAPDDDAPRLVYADWLQERGDPVSWASRNGSPSPTSGRDVPTVRMMPEPARVYILGRALRTPRAVVGW